MRTRYHVFATHSSVQLHRDSGRRYHNTGEYQLTKSSCVTRSWPHDTDNPGGLLHALNEYTTESLPKQTDVREWEAVSAVMTNPSAGRKRSAIGQ